MILKFIQLQLYIYYNDSDSNSDNLNNDRFMKICVNIANPEVFI